jgi:hypothetical protein
MVNYSRQQNLFILCTQPVFTPHTPHKTAVTKVTATPTVIHTGINSRMKAMRQLKTALIHNLDHGPLNTCYLSSMVGKRCMRIQEVIKNLTTEKRNKEEN